MCQRRDATDGDVISPSLLKVTTTGATAQAGPHVSRGSIQSGFLMFQRWSAIG